MDINKACQWRQQWALRRREAVPWELNFQVAVTSHSTLNTFASGSAQPAGPADLPAEGAQVFAGWSQNGIRATPLGLTTLTYSSGKGLGWNFTGLPGR